MIEVNEKLSVPETSSFEALDNVFGKFIPLIPDAQLIMDEYDTIRNNTKDEIVQNLLARTLNPEATYYQKNVKAFIFKIDLLKKYLQDADEHSNFLVVINASDNYTPTAVVALSKSNDHKNFTIVPNSVEEVLEHPGRNGIIKMGNDKFEGNKDVILTLE